MSRGLTEDNFVIFAESFEKKYSTNMSEGVHPHGMSPLFFYNKFFGAKIALFFIYEINQRPICLVNLLLVVFDIYVRGLVSVFVAERTGYNLIGIA